MAKKKSGSNLVFFALLLGIGLSAFLFYTQSTVSKKEVVEEKKAEEVIQKLAINEMAPDFVALDSKGKSHQLSTYKGKLVVLEWKNYTCPFVQKHYSSGNMQALQTMAAEKGIVWLSIVSSAEGQPGYENPEATNNRLETEKSSPTAVLIDDKGIIGNLYHAKVTPTLFIIDQEGKLVYQGAVDDKASTDVADIETSNNFVKAALIELLESKPVTQAQSEAYGCDIKYASK